MLMKLTRGLLLTVSAALAIFPAATRSVSAQEAQAPPQGIEVLARGPVHEGYAEQVNAQPQASPIINKRPPDLIPELPAEQKPEGENVQWISGYWGWDDDRNDYIWVSGFWRTPPPGRQWVPGQWVPAGDGWQWSAGYWN